MLPQLPPIEPFYVSHIYPCGETDLHELPTWFLQYLRNMDLVPLDQDITQLSVHLMNNDHCDACRSMNLMEDQEETFLTHSFICKHDSRFSIADDVFRLFVNHKVIPKCADTAIVTVECSYCGDCQSTTRETLLEAYNSDAIAVGTVGQDDKEVLRKHLKATYAAWLSGTLSPRGYKKLLGIITSSGIKSIAEGEVSPWLQAEKFNQYAIGDIKTAFWKSRLIAAADDREMEEDNGE